MISSVEDLVNQSLRDIGFSGPPIGDIYEGSPAARVALEIYGQTRDELIRAASLWTWPFIRGNTAPPNNPLVVLKTPPPGGFYPGQPWSALYPASGWLYEYAYPPDCLEALAITRPPQFGPDVLDPKPNLWSVGNDLYPNGNLSDAPQRVIFANYGPDAVLIYRRRVTNLLLWEPQALAVLINAVGRKLAASPRLASSANMMQGQAQEEVASAALAMQHRG